MMLVLEAIALGLLAKGGWGICRYSGTVVEVKRQWTTDYPTPGCGRGAVEL
jgi:hypothetical protein